MRMHKFLMAPVVLLTIVALPTQSHLMVARHGTLNLVDEVAFMVMSIPISAFPGIDENRDGRVTIPEFSNNREAVLSAVEDSIFLTDELGKRVLQGILLSPVTPHDGASGELTDITVMGRFTLRSTASALSFENGLYGDNEFQQTLTMSATRRSDGYKAEFVLTPASPARTFFLDAPGRER